MCLKKKITLKWRCSKKCPVPLVLAVSFLLPTQIKTAILFGFLIIIKKKKNIFFFYVVKGEGQNSEHTLIPFGKVDISKIQIL